MTEGRWEEDRTLNCARVVRIFIAAQWNPPLHWAKTERPRCQLLGGHDVTSLQFSLPLEPRWRQSQNQIPIIPWARRAWSIVPAVVFKPEIKQHKSIEESWEEKKDGIKKRRKHRVIWNILCCEVVHVFAVELGSLQPANLSVCSLVCEVIGQPKEGPLATTWKAASRQPLQQSRTYFCH